jgi:hypothetical protein
MRATQLTKILTLAVFCLVFSLQSIAQDTIITSDKKHEVGVDISPFIKNLLTGLGATSGYEFAIMYRFHLKDKAIRSAIGGSINRSSEVINDTANTENNYSTGRIRVGLEYKVNFSKRWQTYYGADLYYAHTVNQYDVTYSSFSTANQFGTINYYGISPLIGFRYKINSRISVTSEASFLIYYFKETHRRTYFPDNKYDQVSSGEGWATRFSPPLMLVVTINF